MIEPLDIENGINISNTNNDPKIWKSCCFQLEAKCVILSLQYTFSLCVLGVATMMVIKADGDCNKVSPWVNIISFMMGKILSTVVTDKK